MWKGAIFKYVPYTTVFSSWRMLLWIFFNNFNVFFLSSWPGTDPKGHWIRIQYGSGSEKLILIRMWKPWCRVRSLFCFSSAASPPPPLPTPPPSHPPHFGQSFIEQRYPTLPDCLSAASVLIVTAIKDLFEDRRRYKSDKRVNNSCCRVFRQAATTYLALMETCFHALINKVNYYVLLNFLIQEFSFGYFYWRFWTILHTGISFAT